MIGLSSILSEILKRKKKKSVNDKCQLSIINGEWQTIDDKKSEVSNK